MRPAAFLRDTRGAVTVEFVIIFPVVVMLLLIIVYFSLMLAAVSDVQQVAHELARLGLRYSAETNAASLCAKLRTTDLPGLIAQSVSALDAQKMLITCTLTNDPVLSGVRFLEVAVRYDFAGQTLADLGRSVGISIASVTRTAGMAI
ncbi:TadE/TadG family type IV pilus assembly protein [Falsigemmobacter intermedius]|uniref:TadE/TadG family type IV pilus assembly protein n=1 Tax=Falsigemmobacter intermedius TaxID=1553448 RepID=UPI003F0C3F07